MTDLARLARDTGFTALGLAVLYYQRMQVRRRENEAELNARLAAVGRAVRPQEPSRS